MTQPATHSNAGEPTESPRPLMLGDWRVGEIHPKSGAECVAVNEHGVPRWRYPAGHCIAWPNARWAAARRAVIAVAVAEAAHAAPAQPLRALARANEVRCGHAALLEQIRARRKGMSIPRTERRTTGALRAAAIVERGREGTLEGRMRIDVLLENVPLLGPTKSDDWIKELGVRTARKRLEELSERQRLQLAHSLRTWAAPSSTDTPSCA